MELGYIPYIFSTFPLTQLCYLFRPHITNRFIPWFPFTASEVPINLRRPSNPQLASAVMNSEKLP